MWWNLQPDYYTYMCLLYKYYGAALMLRHFYWLYKTERILNLFKYFPTAPKLFRPIRNFAGCYHT